MRFVEKFMKDESGATASEYALLLTFIAVIIIAGATALGTAINGQLTAVSKQV
jgi:pilus assembly protein Flp/PilA